MAIKHWVREGGKGYFIGPEEEMYHETDVECPPQPDENYKWEGGRWVMDLVYKAEADAAYAEAELRRTDKYMVIDTQLSDKEMLKAKAYRAELRKMMKKEITERPVKPKFLE